MNVTPSQQMVVTATPIKSFQAVKSNHSAHQPDVSNASRPSGFAPHWKKHATANDTTIALISLQLLILCQNQRSRYNSPVPAPIWSIRSNTPFECSSTSVMRTPRTASETIVRRPIRTCRFGDDFGLTNGT